MNKINRDKILESLTKAREDIIDKWWELNIDLQSLLTITLQWFEYYQGNQNFSDMRDLYKKLITEELWEISEAWLNKDIIEVLDWLVDYLWVQVWYIWFDVNHRNKDVVSDNKNEIILEELTEAFNSVLDKIIIPSNLFQLAWLEIAYSNWTKSLELRDESDEEGKVGKVIKGKDYKKPDLEKVFKYFKS